MMDSVAGDSCKRKGSKGIRIKDKRARMNQPPELMPISTQVHTRFCSTCFLAFVKLVFGFLPSRPTLNLESVEKLLQAFSEQTNLFANCNQPLPSLQQIIDDLQINSTN